MFRKILLGTAQTLLLQPYHRLTRAITLGTRTLALRGDRDILLIRHTYAPGWMLPGGGVESGETIYTAAMREVEEETGIIPGEEPLLHGMFLNDRQFKGDHVACFVLRTFVEGAFKPIWKSPRPAPSRLMLCRITPREVPGGGSRKCLGVRPSAESGDVSNTLMLRCGA